MKDKIKELISSVLNGEDVQDDTRREDCEGWDSLAYLTIISAVEKEFGVEVTPDNINNFDSVPNIIREIERAQNNS